MRVLISLVGEQPTPNLIPLFAASPEQRANHVVFMVSDKPRIKEVAENLRDAIEKDCVLNDTGGDSPKQLTSTLEPMSAWDLEKARGDCARVIEKYEHDEVTVNLTGGTKIMSLAAYQAAVNAKVPMRYVNTEVEELIDFNGDGKEMGRSPFRAKISIETQLRAAGREFNRNPQCPMQQAATVPTDRADFVKWLVENYDDGYDRCMKRVVLDLRKAAKTQKVWVAETALSFVPQGKGLEVLRRLQCMRLLKWNEAAGSILITNREDSLRFLDGGWVEIFALKSLADSRLFDEVQGNVKLKDFAGEIDVLATHNGRLVVIECKTKGPEGEGVTFVAAKLRQHEVIFGGPYARSFFVLPWDEHKSEFLPISGQYGIEEPIWGKQGLKELASRIRESLGP